MPEQSKKTDAAKKLVEAIRAVVDTAGDTAASSKSEAATETPGFWNVFFFLLLIVNMVFLVALIPPHMLEELHWDILKETIPVVGGSFFVIFASWYQELTLDIVRSKIFRGIDIAFSLWFLIFLVPWAHITPKIQPADARYFRDDDTHPVDVGKPLLISLRAHKFTVKWSSGEPKYNERTFKIGGWQSLLASMGKASAQPYWPHLYTVTVQGEATPGIKIRILPIDGTMFDADFLNSDLQEFSLHAETDGSVTFSLPETKYPVNATLLPFGTYTMTPFKKGCVSGVAKKVNVPESPNVIQFESLKGCQQ